PCRSRPRPRGNPSTSSEVAAHPAGRCQTRARTYGGPQLPVNAQDPRSAVLCLGIAVGAADVEEVVVEEREHVVGQVSRLDGEPVGAIQNVTWGRVRTLQRHTSCRNEVELTTP